MTLLRLAACILLVLAAAIIALVLSDRLFFAALRGAVASFSEYELELQDPTLAWYPLRFETDLLLVKPAAEGQAPLFALQGVKLAAEPANFLSPTPVGDLQIDNLSLFIDETAPGGRPDASTILQPLNLFPARVAIRTLHLIDRREDVWIFPLHDVSAETREDGSMALHATAGVGATPLTIDAVLTPQSRLGRIERVGIAAAVLDAGYETALTLRGAVEAADDNLRYDLYLKGAYARVNDFVQAFDAAAVPIAGRLQVAGALTGDLDQMKLVVEQLTVDNAPDYTFDAQGEIASRGDDSPSLNLTLTGSVSRIPTLNAIPAKYRELLTDSAASLAVSGTLAAPVIDNARLTAKTESGLDVTLEATGLAADPQSLDTLLESAPVNFRVQGDSAAALNPLLDTPLPEVGAWSVSGILAQSGAVFRLDNLQASAVLDPGSSLALHGSVTAIEGSADKQSAALRGISATATLEGPGPHTTLAAWSAQYAPGVEPQRLHVVLTGDIEDVVAVRGVDLRVALEDLTLERTGDDAAWLPLPATLSGSTRVLRAGEPWQLGELVLEGSFDAGLRAVLTGQIAVAPQGNSADLQLDLSAAPGGSLPWPGPLQLTSPGATAQIRLRETYATVLGEIRTPHAPLQVIVGADLAAGAPTHLAVDVYAPSFDFADLVYRDALSAFDDSADAAAPAAAPGGGMPPLHATLRIDNLHGLNTAFSSLLVDVEGEQGRFLLRQMDMDYAAGLLQLRGLLDLSGELPTFSLAGQGTRVPLASLARDIGLQESIEGELSIRGGVTGSGATLHALLGSLDGRLAIAANDTVVSGPAYDLLMSNLLAWLATGAAEKTTRFDCAMAQFDIERGVARSEDLFIETPRMLATGKARIDLNEDFVDARLEPRSRTRTLQFPSAVKIKGPLSSPEVSVSPLQATGDAAAQALLLIPSLTLKLFGISARGDEATPPCTVPAA